MLMRVVERGGEVDINVESCGRRVEIVPAKYVRLRAWL